MNKVVSMFCCNLKSVPMCMIYYHRVILVLSRHHVYFTDCLRELHTNYAVKCTIYMIITTQNFRDFKQRTFEFGENINLFRFPD